MADDFTACGLDRSRFLALGTISQVNASTAIDDGEDEDHLDMNDDTVAMANGFRRSRPVVQLCEVRCGNGRRGRITAAPLADLLSQMNPEMLEPKKSPRFEAEKRDVSSRLAARNRHT